MCRPPPWRGPDSHRCRLRRGGGRRRRDAGALFALRRAAPGRGTVAVVPGYVGRSPEGWRPPLAGAARTSPPRSSGGLWEPKRSGSCPTWTACSTPTRRLVPDASRLPRLSYGRRACSPPSAPRSCTRRRWSRPPRLASRSWCATPTPRARVPASPASRRRGHPLPRAAPALQGRDPLRPGHKREAAAVICIGSPARGDLERGQRCLREGG